MKASPGDVFGEKYSSQGNSFSIDKDGTEMEFYGNLNASNGDAFEVIYVFLHLAYKGFVGLPQNEKPSNWSITKNNIQGTGVNEGRQSYQVNFTCSYPPGNAYPVLDTDAS